MLNRIARLVAIFEIPKNNPELARAQIQRFSKQIPIMYTMVIVNTLALAYAHIDLAPTWLTIYSPIFLVSISIVRIVTYRRSGRRELSGEEARHQLKSTVVLAGVLGGIFTAWALMLFPYGTAFTQGHVVFFAGITCIGIMVCLLHLPASALMLALSSIGPLSIYLLLTGHVVFAAVGINLLIVTGAVMYVLVRYSQSFVQLVANQQALTTKAAETQELSDTNERIANLDSLTGLANRRKFLSLLDESLTEQRLSGQSLAVGIFDLDNFKPINDIYGHAAGDRLLIEVAKRLSITGKGAFIARLGGDEFGIICKGHPTDVELMERGERICEAMRLPFDMGNFTARVTGSIGLAKYPNDADSAEELFERADYALYYAKQNDKGEAVLFSEEHRAEIRETSGLERQLREADLDDELSVVFQTIVDGKTGIPLGAEALARWTSPVLGSVPPMAFIRNAEQAGIINQLTEILLKKTLAAVSTWPEELFVSFNLSSHDIGSPQHILKLISTVLNSGIAPQRLTFEITETAILQNMEKANESLRLLKNLGAQIALDDFGTGHSSLSHVHTLPIDRIKVDRSFVAKIEGNQTSRAVVQTIIDLCRNLQIDCIVEGVETEQQLGVLQEMGCRKFQGYLFGRPSEAETVVERLQSTSKTDKRLREAISQIA